MYVPCSVIRLLILVRRYFFTTGDHFRSAASIGNDRTYFLFAYSKVAKITSARVDVGEGDECSSAYTLSYSPDGSDFIDYKTEDGDIKVRVPESIFGKV